VKDEQSTEDKSFVSMIEQDEELKNFILNNWDQFCEWISDKIDQQLEQEKEKAAQVIEQECDPGFVPSYENLPVYYDPYKSNYYKTNIPEDFVFHELIIRFKRSSSKKYYDAVFICEHLPNATTIHKHSEYNSCCFTTQKELFTYEKAIDELLLLIYAWKSTEIILNGEAISEKDLRDMRWIVQQRLIHCPENHKKRLPPLELFDIDTLMKERHDHWKHERYLYQIVCDLFPDLKVIRHARPDWLGGLELDIFVPTLDLAFEYQGIQHFKPIEHWGGEEKLRIQQEHDARKLRLCDAQGITLICINYDENLTASLVKSKIPKSLRYIAQSTES